MEERRWRGSQKICSHQGGGGKQVGNLIGRAGGDGACSTAVGDGHAKEGRGDGMGFDVAFLGQASDKTVKMNTVSAFNAVVVYD